jgi:hypothetical protein
VSEKYAGRQGRCPKCKETITIPAAAEEIIIEEPEAANGSHHGKILADFKPLLRVETKLQPAILAGIIGAAVLAFGVAWLLRGSEWNASVLLLAFGAAILAPPLVLAGYTILRNQELEPYLGSEWRARAAVCSVVYAMLWAVIWALKHWLLPAESAGEGWSLLFLLVPTMALGSTTAWATLDLDPGSGFFHYCLYLGVCVLLRITMGLTAL